jgi:hypothetical protein
MTNPKKSMREQLVGKPLIGFDTRAGVVRTPRVKLGAEIKSKA